MKALSILVIFLVTQTSSGLEVTVQPLEASVATTLAGPGQGPVANVSTLQDNSTADFSCINRTYDMYFPDVSSGCRKFHLCSKTEGEEVLNLSFMCPAGTAFDVRIADCHGADAVVCKEENGSGSRATRKVGETLRAKLNLAQPKTSFKCRGRRLGVYYVDPDTDCTTFHLCTLGDLKTEILDFQFMCLEGTIFDEKGQQCRPRGLATCGTNAAAAAPAPTTAAPLPQVVLEPQLQLQEPQSVAPDQLLLEEVTPDQQLLDPETPAPTPVALYDGDYNYTDVEYDYGDLPAEASEHHVRERRSVDPPLEIGGIVSVVRTKRAPPPAYNIDTVPQTSFTCVGKVPGGYYADVETGCQLYHVCNPGADGNTIQGFKFLCSNGTIFSQQTRTCQTWYTVDCDSTAQFFVLNEELSRFNPLEAPGAELAAPGGVSSAAADSFTASDGAVPVATDAFAEPGVVPQRAPARRPAPRPRPQPQQQLSGTFDEIVPQRRPVQQAAPVAIHDVEDSLGPPAFTERFQQLAEVQRQQDAIRATAAAEPPRRRKQRRRKPRPTAPPQDIPVRDSLQLDLLFGSDSPAVRSTVPRRSAAAAGQEAPTFDIDANIPELLEEIQVRGRFQQSEDDFVQGFAAPRRQPQPQAVGSARRVPLQNVRLQQQESIQVGVPTSQRIPATSDDILAEFGALLPAAPAAAPQPQPQPAARQPQRQQQTRTQTVASQATVQAIQQVPQVRAQPQAVARPTSQAVASASGQGGVFDGFDAFISEAIEEEHRQRARFGAILEQRRQQEEFERQRELQIERQQQQEVQQVQRKKPKKKTRTTTTTPQPRVVNVGFRELPQQQTFVVAPQQQQQRPQTVVSRPSVVSVRQPIIDPATFILSNVQEVPVIQTAPIRQVASQQAQAFQTAVRQVASHQQQQQAQLFQPAPVRHAIHPQQSFPTLTITQPNSNLDTLLLQQLAPRRQPLTVNPAAAVRDILFLVPAESEQSSRTVVAAPRSPVPVPQVTQSQLLRFDSSGSSGFELRATRARRSPQKAYQKPYPMTPFSCKGKVTGGYYADVHTGCRMFHICTAGRKKALLYDFRFWCANDTVFDQRSRTCNSPDKVTCHRSPKYYPRHPLPEEPLDVKVPHAELFKIRVKRAVKNVVAVGPDDYPPTSFRCAGRDANKYFADAETNCRLFHLCAETSPGGRLADYRFLCREGTVFDQRAQACDDQTDALNCQEDPAHYGIGEIFSRTPVV